MNNDLIHVNTLPPFKRLCMTIGELPTSYLETMTYYETLVWLLNYLEKTVIPTINNNGEAIEELQNKYIELKSYVDNYFDNLDVQEEINNKLDEMATDGSLEEIISSYLATKSLLVFDTVDDMKNSENLIAGSYAKTLGYYTKGDKGGYIYKIKETTAEDLTKYQNIILTNVNLCAELIIENNYVTPEMFGAHGDYTTDDSIPIQRAFDYACETGLTLYFQKNYYMSTSIKVKSRQTLGSNYINNINITGNANPRWNFSEANTQSKIKVDDHFLETDVNINTSTTNSLAYITGDIGYLTLKTNDQTRNYYLFYGIQLNTSQIHNITSQGFAGVIYGCVGTTTHIKNNVFLSCYGICFKTFETGVTLFTDCYIHDNYINGGSNTTHGNLFAYGTGHNFYIYNNYIDFFNYIYKAISNQLSFSFIHSSNNTYDQFICINAPRDDTSSWNNAVSGLRSCFFINDRFGVNNGSFPNYLTDTKRCIFDISNYSMHGLTINSCEITDPTPCLLYSSNPVYYPNANSANFKRIIVNGNQCNSEITNQYTQMIQCNPSNERNQFTVFTDMIDNVEELPSGTQFNGRKVIYNNTLYEYYNGWKTIYNS